MTTETESDTLKRLYRRPLRRDPLVWWGALLAVLIGIALARAVTSTPDRVEGAGYGDDGWSVGRAVLTALMVAIFAAVYYAILVHLPAVIRRAFRRRRVARSQRGA